MIASLNYIVHLTYLPKMLVDIERWILGQGIRSTSAFWLWQFNIEGSACNISGLRLKIICSKYVFSSEYYFVLHNILDVARDIAGVEFIKILYFSSLGT